MLSFPSSCSRLGVSSPSCPHCQHERCIKSGKSAEKQWYLCKCCGKRFLDNYSYRAYQPNINKNIISLTKEGCGIRSTARLLGISCGTLLVRIKQIAKKIVPPVIAKHKTFEVDELRTYIKKKTKQIWVVVAVEKSSKQVASFSVGRRTNKTLSVVLQTLKNAEATAIFTDKLPHYRYLIPTKIHQTNAYGTNHVERQNLNLRTHLKRLNRKSICFSKSVSMMRRNARKWQSDLRTTPTASYNLKSDFCVASRAA